MRADSFRPALRRAQSDAPYRLFFLGAQPLLHSLTSGFGKFLVWGFYQLIGVFVGCLAEEMNLLSISATPFAEEEMNPKADALKNGEFVVQCLRLKSAGLPATGRKRSHHPRKGLR